MIPIICVFSTEKHVAFMHKAQERIAKRIFLKRSTACIPRVFQNLGISQNQRSRFGPIETASYPRDRGDADRAKDRDADTGKNQVLNHERYKSF